MLPKHTDIYPWSLSGSCPLVRTWPPRCCCPPLLPLAPFARHSLFTLAAGAAKTCGGAALDHRIWPSCTQEFVASSMLDHNVVWESLAALKLVSTPAKHLKPLPARVSILVGPGRRDAFPCGHSCLIPLLPAKPPAVGMGVWSSACQTPPRTASSKGPPSNVGNKPEFRTELIDCHFDRSSSNAFGKVSNVAVKASVESWPLKGAVKLGANP